MIPSSNRWDEESSGWFLIDYGIRYINLPYALFLIRINLGVQVNIITLSIKKKTDPPNVMRNYETARPILEFLDEVGCNIYTNPILHSKMILSNDLALIGSFNLSKAALYNNEELGISIEDVSHLEILENYVCNIMKSSTPFGYSANLRQKYSYPHTEPILEKVTRGWLLEQIVRNSIIEDWRVSEIDRDNFSEFLFFYGQRSIYGWRIAEEIGFNPEAFYTKILKNYFQANKVFEELLSTDANKSTEMRYNLRKQRTSYLKKCSIMKEKLR
jgi:hypothetical protein